MATPNTNHRSSSLHDDVSNTEAAYSPIRSGASHQEAQRDENHLSSQFESSSSDNNSSNNNELNLMLSRKVTTNSSAGAGRGENTEELAEIQRLISRMFGRERKAQSAEEQSRHSGVIWKNLKVKGAGLGAALQPTVGDIFLALPRLVGGLLTRGRKGAGKNVPVKTILHDFTVS